MEWLVRDRRAWRGQRWSLVANLNSKIATAAHRQLGLIGVAPGVIGLYRNLEPGPDIVASRCHCVDRYRKAVTEFKDLADSS